MATYTIKCADLVDPACDFTVQGKTADEAKTAYYQHGAESPRHSEVYNTASEDQRAAFVKMLDEYLAKQE